MFLAMGLLGGSCCKKDEPVAPVNRLIPAEMRAYWDFKPGTYWVYQDSANGLVDTMTVVTYENDTFLGTLNYDQSSAWCEFLELRTIGSDGAEDYFTINTTYAGSNYSDVNVVWHSRYGDPEFNNGYTKCFVYPYETDNITYWFGGLDDACKFEAKYDSAFGYTDVVEMSNAHNLAEPNYQPTRTYWAKNIGLVRKVLVDSNRVYNLIDYHIEP